MVKSKAEKKNLVDTAFSQKTFEILKNVVVKDLNNEVVSYLIDGIGCNLDQTFSKPDNGLDQLNTIENVGKKLHLLETENTDCYLPEVLKPLSFLFIQCKSKHAVRRAIASVLQGLPEHLKHFAVTELLHYLQTELINLQERLFQLENTSDEYFELFNKGINTMTALMENFPLGKTVIRKSKYEVFQFVDYVLTRELTQLSVATSLDAQSTSMANVLSSLKIIIAALQCCRTSSKEMPVLALQSTACNSDIQVVYIKILKKALGIIQLSNYLLDCRNAAGVVVISILQTLLSTHPLTNAINMFLDNYGSTFYQDESKSNSALDDQCIVDVNSDKTVKSGPAEAMESIIQANDSVKQETEVNCTEQQVLKIVENICRGRRHCIISRLVICHGIVTKLDSDSLHGSKQVAMEGINPKDTSYDGLFCTILLDSLLEICSTVNDKGATVFAFKTLFCWTVEALGHCKKLKASASFIELELYAPNREITSKVVKTLNSYLDHPIDAVRYQVRNSLENMIRIMNLFSDSTNHITDLIKLWMRGSLRLRSNCMALSCIINYVHINDMLRIKTSFPQDLIDCLDDANLVSHICDLYIKSASKHRSEIPDFQSNYLDWVTVWCQPVYQILSCADRTKRSAALDYLVPGLLIAFPNLISIILDRSKESVSGKDDIITAVVFLSRARTLKECAKVKLAGENSENSNLWHGLISMASLKHCLCHIDDQVRMDTLALICEANKITESFTDQDFKLLQFFIPLNMTNQSPLIRSQLICSLKKAFCRMMEQSRTILNRVDDFKSSQDRKDSFVKDSRKGGPNEDSTKARIVETAIETGLNEIAACTKFLKWLLKFLFDCLHSGSSFPRVNTALEIIRVFLKVSFSSTLNPTCFTELLASREVFTKLEIRTLIGCFHDSFAVNRNLANEILSMLPRDFFTFDADELVSLINETLSLAKSSQTDDTSAAPYFVKLLMNENMANKTEDTLLNLFIDCKNNSLDNTCRYTAQLMFGNVLLNILDEQMKIAKFSLVDAAMNAPMYGILNSLREMLSTVRLKAAKNRILWRSFINRIVTTCFEINDIVSPIMSSNAPEGHLISESADHNVMVSQAVEERSKCNSAQFGNSGVHSTQSENGSNISIQSGGDGVETNSPEYRSGSSNSIQCIEKQAHQSQLLLICCWRSMKEIALILADIASNSPVYNKAVSQQIDSRQADSATNSEDQPLSNPSIHESETDDFTGFISANTVIKIGHLFINLLLSSRHVGAFELAYPGFVKICSMLWKSEAPQLKILPSQWIEDLVSDLQSFEAGRNFCVTRRSAGIPFYISAICSTEPAISRRTTFKKVMEVLLTICRDASSLEQNPENQNERMKKVIGLNVLRAMFKDTKFGEDVFPYVSNGFIIAINGFSSHIWAIRNSCTLLFSALMSRVFGLKKSVMSGTEFFSRFSELYPFLLHEMKKITDVLFNQRNHFQLHPSVFPVLYLLSHLYPSSLDGTANNMTLSFFLPFINRCSESSVYKIRSMAAESLVSIVTPSRLPQVLNDIITSMMPSTMGDLQKHNWINGCLMKVKALLKGKATNPVVSSSLRGEIIKGPLIELNQLTWILSRGHLCSLNKALLLEIINENVLAITKNDETSLSDHQQALLNSLKKQCLVYSVEELGIASYSSEERSNEADKNQLEMIGCELLRKQCMSVVENFLHNPHHWSTIGREYNSSDLVLSLVQLLENEVHDLHLPLLSFLEKNESFAFQNEVVMKILQKRLMVDERNLDCLAGICRLLAKQPHKIVFPWVLLDNEEHSCIEVWNVLKTKTKAAMKRENVRMSLLRFGIVIVSQLLPNIKDPKSSTLDRAVLQCLVEIFYLVIDSCKPEEYSHCRKVAAEVISSDVFLDIARSVKGRSCSDLVNLVLDYWKCVLNLLQDEEVEIRLLTARRIYPFIEEESSAESLDFFTDVPTGYFMQPSLVLELLIKVISDIYSSACPVEITEFLLSLVIGKSSNEIARFVEKECVSTAMKCDFHCPGDGERLSQLNSQISTFLCHETQVSEAIRRRTRGIEYGVDSKDSQLDFLAERTSGLDDTSGCIGGDIREISGATVMQESDTASIFDESESNAYFERITIGHLALDELQNLITARKIPSLILNNNFVQYIWMKLKGWILDISSFYSKDNVVCSSELLMGIYVLFCTNDNEFIKRIFKDGLGMFFNQLDSADFNVIHSTTLFNHVINIRALCQV